MVMFSNCSGQCKDCYCYFVDACIAGHGDDHFTQITKKEAIRIIRNGWAKERQLKELFERYPDIERSFKINKLNGKI